MSNLKEETESKCLKDNDETAFDEKVLAFKEDNLSTGSFAFFNETPLQTINQYNNENVKKYDRCHKSFLQEKISKTEARYLSAAIPSVVQEEAFVWLATKEKKGSIYIFGTMHSDLVNDVFEEPLRKIISDVVVVFTEIEMSSSPEERTLDVLVAEIASQKQKIIKPLESDRIRKVIGVIDNGEQLEITDLELRECFLNHVPLPKNSDSKTDQRTAFWMEDILSESENKKDQNILIAVGANHTQGKFGLPNLLAYEGYELVPFMKNRPLPEEEITIEHGSTLFLNPSF